MQGDPGKEIRKLTIVGNSSGVTIPPRYQNALDIKEGDRLQLSFDEHKEEIKLEKL